MKTAGVGAAVVLLVGLYLWGADILTSEPLALGLTAAAVLVGLLFVADALRSGVDD